MRALARGAGDETYAELSRMVYSTAYKFCLAHKVKDLEEIQAEAHLLYSQAYAEYDSRRGAQFITWAQFKIWHGLLEVYRTDQRRRYSTRHRVEMPDDVPIKEPSTFDLDDFLLDLTDDSRTLILTVLEADPAWFVRYGDKEVTPRAPIKVVRGLMMSKGWERKRITKAIEEIRRRIK